jgi:protein O-mannosyl-transferase
MFDRLDIRQKYSLLVVLLLIILTLGVYWPVQNYDFINFDDSLYIIKNDHVRNGITLDGLSWAFSTKYFGLWNPLVWISFMTDSEFFRFNPGGYHWTNVILHLFDSILLFFVFRNLTGAIWRSAFVAGLFAIHPINVESVAWIAERKNVLSTFFWMLTILFYSRYVRQPHWKRYLPVFISLALGLMAKPMLVTLPFVLLLLDYWPLNRTAINTQSEVNIEAAPKKGPESLYFLILEKAPLFLLSAISIWIMFYSPHSASVPQFQRTVDPVVIQRIYNAIFSYAMYLKKLFWPQDLYIPYLYLNIPVWQIVLSAVTLIIITFFVCKHLKKYPYLPVGWFWFLGTLVPVIGIQQIGEHTMADRYAYVTFIGVFIMIAWGMGQISLKKIFLKKLFIFSSIAAVVLLTAATHYQLKLWNNTITLFQYTLKMDPNNYVAYAVMGQDLADQGKYEKALYYYDKTLKLNPGVYVAYINKGVVLLKLGKQDEAVKVFEEAIKLDNSFSAYYQIGFIYFSNNDLDRTIAYALKTIERKPDDARAYNLLGAAFMKKGKIQEGIAQFQKVLLFDPNNKNARNNLQLALKKKRGDSGIVPDVLNQPVTIPRD